MRASPFVIASERQIAERSNPVRGPPPAGLLRRFASRNDDSPRHYGQVPPSLRAGGKLPSEAIQCECLPRLDCFWSFGRGFAPLVPKLHD
ncbi:MAG: hypothetical protein LBT00_03220 [Spirochaetaceae bacterium]|nr:hypothetical protein [Spirochaetaceae bacterium]